MPEPRPDIEALVERMRGRLYRFTGLVNIVLPSRKELVNKIDDDLTALAERIAELERERESALSTAYTYQERCIELVAALRSLRGETTDA